jgi:hypothetical protein
MEVRRRAGARVRGGSRDDAHRDRGHEECISPPILSNAEAIVFGREIELIQVAFIQLEDTFALPPLGLHFPQKPERRKLKMLRNIIGAAAAAVMLLALSSTVDTAQARRGGHGGHVRAMGGGKHFAVRHVRSARIAFHRRAHFRRGVVVGVYGHGRCAWLRHRAIVTGSRYWWRRYWRCRHGYSY